MIEPDFNVFPGNALIYIGAAMENIDSDIPVFQRPLRPSDPNQSIGVFAVKWTPNQNTLEMGHQPSGEPTVQTYQLAVQALVKHGDKDVALAVSTVLSRRIRNTLYRDPALALALQALSVNDGFSQERFMRATLRSQDFMNNQVKTTFAYISVLDVLIETETT